MIWLLLLGVCTLLALWLRWRHKNRRLLKMAELIPGPPALPFLGNAVKFMCNPEELILVIKDMLTEYGDTFRFWLGPDLNIVVNNPDDLKILLSNNKTSVKGPQYKYMADVLGGGILSGSGVVWRKHRKIATPNYGKRAIESYNVLFNREVVLLLEVLQTVPSHTQFDIYKKIVRTTSFTVCQTLMGLSREETINLPGIQYIIDTSPRLYDIVFDRMTKWYLQIDPVFWLSDAYKVQKNFISNMNEFSRTIIESRMKKLKSLDKSELDLIDTEGDSLKNTKLSVIDRFLLSRDFNTENILSETFTIFTSSQEATAKISSFLLLMMAYHPGCQEKLYNEIRNVIDDKHEPITDDHLKQMSYLDMVFKEILRLYPIGAMLQRTINEDITISSGTIPAGSSVVAPIYHLHRDPRFWDRPEEFDPERFTPENIKRRQPNCYIPFSVGPMDCLGRYFGTKLVKTICVKVLQDFKLSSNKQYKDLRISIAISASSLDGFHLQLTPRNKF